MDQSSAIYARTLNLTVRGEKGPKSLLSNVSFDIPTGNFVAVVGASGCGKSTLIKTLAGLYEATSGQVLLGGHPVQNLKEAFPLAVGYLPQFGAFHDDLTVDEILNYAVSFRLPKTVPEAVRQQWKEHIASLARLGPFIHQSYKTLSGGQMRRVALAEELIGDPPFLFLDELTSGLDPYSEQEMMIWLNELAHTHHKTILLVTHAVTNLHYCDSVLFMHKGHLVYHGDSQSLLAHHGVASIEELFQSYQVGDRSALQQIETQYAVVPGNEIPVPQALQTAKPPGGFSQVGTLMVRQFTLLMRDKGQLWLQLMLLIIFPALVAVFATEGLPQVRNLSLSIEKNILRTLQEQLLYLRESFNAASLISGLTMFQVILLMLMASNNGAREIAKERNILNKELRAGLSGWAYVWTKSLLVFLYSLIQAFWMTWFVKSVCGFPGQFTDQFLALFVPTVAMSMTCLGISAAARSPERASLLAIYLVGLQLPLSGAVLALPEWLSWMSRPFIAAYWGWSGYLKSLESFRHYDIVKQSTDTFIAGADLCLGVLLIHVLAGAFFSWLFVIRKKNEV